MFIAVARFQNFRRAAQALGVTQSALSQAISQMEYLIDVPLLQRNRRHVALTPAGQDFLTHAIRVRSEAHTSELQSLMRISYAVFCLKRQNSIREVNINTDK